MTESTHVFIFQGGAVGLLARLSRVSLFSGLSVDELLPLTDLVEVQRLEDGEVLCELGDPGDALYLVIEGSLLALRGGQIVGRLGPGEVAGELAIVDGGARTASLRAVGAVEIHRIAREDLLALLDTHPGLAMNLLAMISQRLEAPT